MPASDRRDDKPPPFSNWKDAWEWEAAQARQSYEGMPEDELITLVKQGRFDWYYTLWLGFRKNGTLKKSGPVLLDVLRRTPGSHLDVLRNHAAGALFHLLGYDDEPLPELRARVQWDHEGEDARQSALDELEAVLRERLRSRKKPHR